MVILGVEYRFCMGCWDEMRYRRNFVCGVGVWGNIFRFYEFRFFFFCLLGICYGKIWEVRNF